MHGRLLAELFEGTNLQCPVLSTFHMALMQLLLASSRKAYRTLDYIGSNRFLGRDARRM